MLNGYTFIDLFAGIGGFHLALTSTGAKCVFASEWDSHAAKVYENNFGLKPFGDITKINELDIPCHDILCGGFPCQAFSISGKQQGFDDTRGTLFFDIVRIAKHHSPKVIFLENVKNLSRHDGGRTLHVIIETLTGLGYTVHKMVLNASHYGLPQNRERIYIVCFRNDLLGNSFVFPPPSNNQVCVGDVLEVSADAKIIDRPDIVYTKKYVPEKDLFGNFTLPNKPIQIGTVNKGGQGERIYSTYGHAITLSAYGGGVGSKTGIYLVENVPRKLSPRECARLQGFPDWFQIDSSKSQAYKQFGNSVAVVVVTRIAEAIAKALNNG